MEKQIQPPDTVGIFLPVDRNAANAGRVISALVEPDLLCWTAHGYF